MEEWKGSTEDIESSVTTLSTRMWSAAPLSNKLPPLEAKNR